MTRHAHSHQNSWNGFDSKEDVYSHERCVESGRFGNAHEVSSTQANSTRHASNLMMTHEMSNLDSFAANLAMEKLPRMNVSVEEKSLTTKFSHSKSVKTASSTESFASALSKQFEQITEDDDIDEVTTMPRSLDGIKSRILPHDISAASAKVRTTQSRARLSLEHPDDLEAHSTISPECSPKSPDLALGRPRASRKMDSKFGRESSGLPIDSQDHKECLESDAVDHIERHRSSLNWPSTLGTTPAFADVAHKRTRNGGRGRPAAAGKPAVPSDVPARGHPLGSARRRATCKNYEKQAEYLPPPPDYLDLVSPKSPSTRARARMRSDPLEDAQVSSNINATSEYSTLSVQAGHSSEDNGWELFKSEQWISREKTRQPAIQQSSFTPCPTQNIIIPVVQNHKQLGQPRRRRRTSPTLSSLQKTSATIMSKVRGPGSQMQMAGEMNYRSNNVQAGSRPSPGSYPLPIMADTSPRSPSPPFTYPQAGSRPSLGTAPLSMMVDSLQRTPSQPSTYSHIPSNIHSLSLTSKSSMSRKEAPFLFLLLDFDQDDLRDIFKDLLATQVVFH